MSKKEMATELLPKCLLGNGYCPPQCPHYEAAKKITEELGDDFNPFLSRVAVVFGDVSHGVNVGDVAKVIGSCVNEKKREVTPTLPTTIIS
jgi:hypothetical protein